MKRLVRLAVLAMGFALLSGYSDCGGGSQTCYMPQTCFDGFGHPYDCGYYYDCDN